MPGSRAIRPRFLGPGRDPADYEQVTDILDVWFDSGSTHATVLEQRADLAVAGLALPRGLGPAPRLVPLLAARELRHARPGALRGGADPRLRGRRARPQDVEVARQRRLAARPDEDPRRRHPAPVDGAAPTTARTCGSARRSWPARPTPTGGCATRCATCSATSPASARPSGCRTSRCRSSSAGCCIAWPSSTGWCARPTATSTFRGCTRAAQFLRDRPVGVLLRRAQGRALLRSRRTACGGAPRAPCSTSCSTASPPGWRRCWCSPPRRPGSRAIRPRTGSVHLRAVPGVPAALARPGARRPLGAHPPGAAGGHRRARGRAPRQADRREPRGGAAGVRRRGRCRGSWPASTSPSSRS